MQTVVGTDRGWVFAQTILLVTIAVVGPYDARRRERGRCSACRRFIGALLMLCSVLIARRARADLAESFTMSPTPQQGSALIDSGVYGAVRHPMYGSVLLGVGGYTIFWWSWRAAVGLLVTMGFLSAKIAYEERQLSQRYPAYSAYRAAVRYRLMPRVY